MIQQFVDDDYRQISGHESYGKHVIGVRILVASNVMLTDEEQNLITQRCAQLHNELLELRAMHDPEEIKIGAVETASLIACFQEPISVRSIPNRYDGSLTRPWLEITTPRGLFIVGWRRRVINIDWSNTDIEQTAEELFPEEQVTKLAQSIHAWNYADCKRYVNVLLAANRVSHQETDSQLA